MYRWHLPDPIYWEKECSITIQQIGWSPEVRKEKVLDVRQQLTKGQYDINDRLDIALDKVLEDLTT